MNFNLREVQLIQLEIALEVKRICLKNNINYFLDAGTLLGAVRHNGFIPWDDDLDIGFLREDYELFLECAAKDLHEDFILQTWKSDEGYGLPFAKIRKKNTKYVELKSANIKSHQGIFIDLFAYDKAPESKIKQLVQKNISNVFARIILIKRGYEPWMGENGFKKNIYLIYKFMALFIPTSVAIKLFEYNNQLYNNTASKLRFICDGNAYDKWMFDENLLSNLTNHLFESNYFSIPKDYDKYLTIGYGDYMKPPKQQDRGDRHMIVEVDY